MKATVTLITLKGDGPTARACARFVGAVGKLKSESGDACTWRTVYAGKDASSRYNLHTIPTIIVEVGGTEFGRITGTRPYARLRELLTSASLLTLLCSPSPFTPRNGVVHVRS